MVINILAYLIIKIPLVMEVAQDIHDFKNKKKDKKALDVLYRFLILIPCTYVAGVITGQTIWQGFILAIGQYIMFFDPIMGYVVNKDIMYLGETSKLDRILAKVPKKLLLVIRGILFAGSIAAYYFI